MRNNLFSKKRLYVIFSLAFALILIMNISSVTASDRGCRMNVTLINQDPFPAMPGEYVEVVFQLHEVDDKTCDGASIQVVPEHPFSLAEGEESIKELFGPRWITGHKRAWMIPYKFKVDKDSIDGWHDLEVRFAEENVRRSYRSRDFKIKVDDVQTSFELGIRDYNPGTGEITLEILNVGGNDVEALVLEIPQQENIGFMGSNRNVIGILDSNEDTSARFRITEVEEGEIEVKVKYNDQIDERREVTESVYFNPDIFRDDLDKEEGLAISTYIIILLVLAFIGYWFYKRKEKKKELEKLRKKS